MEIKKKKNKLFYSTSIIVRQILKSECILDIFLGTPGPYFSKKTN